MLIYLSIKILRKKAKIETKAILIAKKAGFKMKTQEKVRKIGVRDLLLLVKALEKVLASLLFNKLVDNKRFYWKIKGKQDLKDSLIIRLILKNTTKIFFSNKLADLLSLKILKL